MKITNSNFSTKLKGVLEKSMNFIANQKHIQAISYGVMYLIPLTLLAAIFNIIKTPPITAQIMQEGGWAANIFGGWYNFAQTYGNILSVPVNMTVGVMGIVAVLGISYNLAKSYGMKPLPTALTSLIMFLIISAPATTAYLLSNISAGMDLTTVATSTVLDSQYLGSQGLFIAIVVAVFSTEITRFCADKNLVIKMPDSVPPNVADSFSTVIPALVNCAFFFGMDLLLKNYMGTSLPSLIMTVLTPAIDNVNTPVAIIGIITFGNLLWAFGIHGPAIISMLYIPVSMGLTAANMELVAGGQAPVWHPVFMTHFSNVYFGLTLLMLFAKSSQLKAVGKIGIIPALFVINEPVIFGAPIMYNPVLIIPHLVGPIITMTLSYIAGSMGFLAGDVNLVFAQLPLGLNSFLQSMSFNNLFFYVLMLGVQILIWVPFVKIYDKQLCKQEKVAESKIDSELLKAD